MPQMLQYQNKSAISGNVLKSSNAGGTGGLDDHSIEAEYIVSFSDEVDDSQVGDIKNAGITLNQQLIRQQRLNKNSMVTIMGGVDSLIS